MNFSHGKLHCVRFRQAVGTILSQCFGAHAISQSNASVLLSKLSSLDEGGKNRADYPVSAWNWSKQISKRGRNKKSRDSPRTSIWNTVFHCSTVTVALEQAVVHWAAAFEAHWVQRMKEKPKIKDFLFTSVLPVFRLQFPVYFFLNNL